MGVQLWCEPEDLLNNFKLIPKLIRILTKQRGKIKIKHGLIIHGYVHQPRLKWQSVKVSRLANFSYPQFLIGRENDKPFDMNLYLICFSIAVAQKPYF